MARGIGGVITDEEGNVKKAWDPFLPRPPSMKDMNASEDRSASEQVAVFGANTKEGTTLVRMMSEKGLRVVAAVRILGSNKMKQLIDLPGVTVKQADANDRASLLTVLKGCSRAFAVTRYWEKFESVIEETMATNILDACASVSPPVKNLVLATFEEISDLRKSNRKSQIVPTRDGKIYPDFGGKSKVDTMGKSKGVTVTHMMTSFMDENDHKKSLILLRGMNKRIVVNSHVNK
mmetsp:Transcript_11714/g.28152  ORF Transcript_11714/g.28152 Transcript_11714/m.28152 type:complete len:234 (+) Transcript_11714:76-777(+)|eukprot:CAMPEP_0113627970 /NCGR_PEP_ID=MMETSP0017_2-20120614/14488_1 /TAXON_ID=2856 /ORGANISM="Cylindrotheca closterium" /LENGTH=233 /DNA_ID=CAMNT_0000538249 /DNA_START=66 /DNA_END=767 /DNA_ORIENTATION=+ /assembly_acc=CAM_ASM_000147